MTDWIRTPCDSNTCVEVRRDGVVVQVRSSTQPAFHLDLSVPEWVRFVDAIRRGHFAEVGRAE